MWNARTLTAFAFGALLLTPGLEAQELLASRSMGAPGFAQYRKFVLTSSLATVSAAAGVPASEAKMIHQRPAVLQDLEWRPSRWIAGSMATSTDPVEQIVFSFYNDQLFRITVDYARDRTEGMTDADMVEAIQAVYGTPNKRAASATGGGSQSDNASGSAVATWGDAGRSVVLYHTSAYGEAYRLIVTEQALDRLARKATIDAARLDERDAPRLEVERQKKERDDGRAAAEKARAVNKAAFKT